MRGCCREGREGDFDEALLRDERYGTRRQRETKQRETLTRQSLPASSEAERETLTRLSCVMKDTELVDRGRLNRGRL